MNTPGFSETAQHVGYSRPFAMDVDMIPSAEETLVSDARAGVPPSEMVDRKLLVALGGTGACDHTRPPERCGEQLGTRPRQTRPV